VKRRQLNKLLALGAVSIATGIDFDRYAAVLAGTRADAAALDDFETITLDYIRREPTVSPQSLLPGVRGHLGGLRDILVWTPPALAPRAYSLAGQTALLAGYLWYQRGDYAQADVYWSLAERWAEMAGDVRLRAALLELQASRWYAPGDFDNIPRALLLLDRAVALLGPRPDPGTAAYILSFRARYYAEAGRVGTGSDQRPKALIDIDKMQVHLSRMPSADARVYIVGSVTGETTQGHARALVHMDRAADGVLLLERLLASVDDGSLKWRAGIIADLAAAHAAMNEHEHASDLLADALSLAQQAGAGRKINRVRETRQRWLSNHDGPALRRLDEQLRALPGPAPASVPPLLPAS
jgi:tetratricopeptide (TPR) repeat protein